MKKIFEKIKAFFGKCWKILVAIGTAVSGVFVLLFLRGKTKNETRETEMKTKAEKAKEEVYEKIKNTDADTLVRDSDDASHLRRRKDELKAEMRKRIRDKLNKRDLH